MLGDVLHHHLIDLGMQARRHKVPRAWRPLIDTANKSLALERRQESGRENCLYDAQTW